MSIYLLECVVDDGRQISIGYFGEDFPDSASNMLLVFRISHRFTMKGLPLLVVRDAPLYVCRTIYRAVSCLAQTMFLAVPIMELLASKFNDFKRKMMAYTVDVRRDLLRVKESFAARFGLPYVR